MPDKLGPIEIEFVLDKQADEQAKKLKTSLDAVGMSSKKSVADLKVSIKEQKELIKSIEQDVKNLQKAYDNAAASQAKSNAGAAVGQAKRALTEERGRLAGLQKEQAAANEAESSTIGRLVGKIGAWAMGLATVGAAMKITKAIIASTEGTAHAFEVVVAEATSGIGYFFKAIASGDWSDFGNGLREAIKGAKAFTDAMEEVQRLKNQEKMVSSDIQKTIAADLELTYDRSDANNKEAIAAYDRIIKNTELQFTAKIEAAQKEFDAALAEASTDTGGKVSQDEILNITKNYKSIKEVYELGQKWKTDFAVMRAEADKILFTEGKTDKWKAATEKIKAAQAAAPIAEKIDLVTFSAMDSIANLYKTLGDLEASKESGNKLFKRRQAALVNEEKKAAEDAAKKAIEDAKTENQIKIQTELLNKAIEDNNAVEIKDIGERIRKLEEELVVRQRIAEAAIAATMTREIPIPMITGFKAPTLLPGGLKIPNIFAGAPIYTPTEKSNERIQRAKNDLLDEEIKKRNEILRAASQLTFEIAKQMGFSEEGQQALGAALAALEQGLSGDWPAAAATMISGLLQLIPNEAEKFALQIEHINNLIAQQQRLIEKSSRLGGTDVAIKDQMELLKQEKALQDEAVRIAEINLRDKQGAFFGIGIGVNDAKKKLEEAKQAAIEAGNAIEDLQQEYDDFMRGGITENTIADVIMQGLEEGKTGIDDFGQYMNDVLKTALQKAFMEELLSGPKMKAYMAWLTAAMEDGITPAEATENARLIAEMTADNKAKYDAWMSGITATNDVNSTLSGAIKGISEETASVLAGQVNNIRISQALSAGIMSQQLMHLAKIETNTAHLISIDNKLSALGKTGSLRSQGLQV